MAKDITLVGPSGVKYKAGLSGGKPNLKIADSKDPQLVKQVISQLEDDFPKSALSWIPKYDWQLKTVPLDDIDFDNVKDWQASKEPNKVRKFARRISRGIEKPIVLVNLPGESKFRVVDGHHRTLAYRFLDKSAKAYVAQIEPEDEDKAYEMHDKAKNH